MHPRWRFVHSGKSCSEQVDRQVSLVMSKYLLIYKEKESNNHYDKDLLIFSASLPKHTGYLSLFISIILQLAVFLSLGTGSAID